MKIVAAAALLLSLTAAAMAQSAIPALPKDMLGIWGFDAESCGQKNSDTLITVQAKEVEFFASAYTLKTIRRQADGTVTGAGARTEEGKPGRWRTTIKLKLLSPDNSA